MGHGAPDPYGRHFPPETYARTLLDLARARFAEDFALADVLTGGRLISTGVGRLTGRHEYH
jgi:hypothetical protein